jgi:hypothetical protein
MNSNSLLGRLLYISHLPEYTSFHLLRVVERDANIEPDDIDYILLAFDSVIIISDTYVNNTQKMTILSNRHQPVHKSYKNTWFELIPQDIINMINEYLPPWSQLPSDT